MPTQSPASASPAPSPAPASSDKRYVIAPELKGILHVVSVGLETGPQGFLKLQVAVQNLTPAPQSFDYRIDWFNKDGELLPGISGLTQKWMLLGGEISQIAVTAPAPTAVDFGIAFLPARE